MRRRDFIAGQATALFYNPPLTIPVLRTPDSLLKPDRFDVSPDNAFRTSDCEIPNCRAIRDGVTPALNAARTAFSFP